MKKIFFLLIIINYSLLIDNCFCQWVLQNSGTNVILFNVQFVNRYTGWVTGANSTILKTTDGGQNWFQQQSNLTTSRNLYGIDMLDASTGYIAGQFYALLKTTNSGNNWTVLREGPYGLGVTFNDIDFINEQTGWICGFGGSTYRTTNGGLNWDSVYVGSGGPLRDILFINNKTGWVAGDVGFIRKTTNGGANWFFQFQGTMADYRYNSLSFINENTGWVVGYNEAVFGTTNGGSNWDTLSTVPGMCIFFVNAFTGWTGTPNGLIYKTTNGGYNWYEQTYPSGGGWIHDINFVTDSIGWSISTNRIIYTTNAGGEFVGVISQGNKLPASLLLKQNYPNPFNAETIIEFNISESEIYTFEIFDLLGRKIKTLFNEYKIPGEYKFTYKPVELASGIYLYRLSSKKYSQTKKFILVK